MKWLPFLSLLIVAVACQPTPNKSSVNKPGTSEPASAGLTKIEGMSRYALAQPISYGNMSLVPIVDVSKEKASQDTDQGDYVSLAEAKKLGWIAIQEVPDNAQVNTLEVTNRGKKSVLLLAGELLLGGQQDRIVAKDTIVPPGKTIQVPVFCVEPHRWEGADKRFDSGNAMVPQSVRDEANYGDQQKVWDKVGRYNNDVALKSKVVIGGSSVRGGLSDKEVQARISGDLPKFTSGLSKVKNVVGFLYVLNGEVQSAEVFGDSRLFNAGRDGLLKGFLADAAVAKSDEKAKVSLMDCATFFKEAMGGERQRTATRAGNADWDIDGAMAVGKESTLPSAAASSPTGGAGKGFLHGTYKKK